MFTPLPSKSGPCDSFARGRGTKFCVVCGHTHGKHFVRSPFEVVAELVYDPETDELRSV